MRRPLAAAALALGAALALAQTPPAARTLADPDAMTDRALLITIGRIPARYPGEAISLFERAAARGNARAQAQLGREYLLGRNLTYDAQLASQWFKRSADQGYGWGEYFYGLQSLKGIGVARDLDTAREYLERAARQEIPPALYELGRLYDLGLGVAADPARARALLERAAALGYGSGSPAPLPETSR